MMKTIIDILVIAAGIFIGTGIVIYIEHLRSERERKRLFLQRLIRETDYEEVNNEIGKLKKHTKEEARNFFKQLYKKENENGKAR